MIQILLLKMARHINGVKMLKHKDKQLEYAPQTVGAAYVTHCVEKVTC